MMGNSEDNENEVSRLKVTDRRQFTSEGEARQESESSEAETPREESPPQQTEEMKSPDIAEQDLQESEQDSQESINFSSFLLSIATTGMVHLGEIPEPTTGQAQENLEAARQMIDIVGILKEKTEGNLSSEESQLLENLLYELRMKFLSKSKAVEL
ncbi:MAG: DUF1844 domain-containing protein [Acidobacteriota bacterium]|nr:DUF1844 domain-containing protein [Acidobacteriota bacterium]